MERERRKMIRSYDRYIEEWDEYTAIVDVAKLCADFDEAIKERDDALKHAQEFYEQRNDARKLVAYLRKYIKELEHEKK